ncbi:MAG: hypothetical protein HEEMFOPI_00309 [Holosporales bacterium]
MKRKSIPLFLSLCLTSSFVFAGKAPSVVISAATSIAGAAGKQKIKSGGKKDGAPLISIGQSDLYFTASGESDKGLTYKWRANITAIPGIIDIDRNYIEFGHDAYGTLQVGAVGGTEDTFTQGAFKLIGGAVGLDGTSLSIFNMSSGVINGIHLTGYTRRANKIVVSSPVVSGFQVGFSYTPNTSISGRQSLNNDSMTKSIGNDSGLYPDKENSVFGTNNIAAGLSYNNAWDDFSVNADVTYVYETSKFSRKSSGSVWTVGEVNNVSAYQVGVVFGYKNWRFGGSFTNNGKSRLPKSQIQVGGSSYNLHEGNAGKAFDVGVQYKMDAYQFAVAYFNTKRKFDSTGNTGSDAITFTADYSALPGLKFFAEVDIIRSKTCQNAMNLANAASSNSAIDNNNGEVFVVGTRISF